MKSALPCIVCLALTACDQPAEPDGVEIETAYLADRVNGESLPETICAAGGTTSLEFESIALREDETYGRLQITRAGSGNPLEQREEGRVARTDSTILLINAAEDTLLLTLLDEDGDFVRRIHTCGDTIRYASVPVGDA
jgi:hypothetical protein